MAGKTKKSDKLLTYKGKPLVRSGNTVYYGDMADPYVAMLQCSDFQDYSDLKLPGTVPVQILATDEDLPLKDRLKNRTEKPSLYEAMNIASIWLERYLEEE
jgi:hypothetical protein